MEHETQDQESRLEAVIAGARGVERPENAPGEAPAEEPPNPGNRASPRNRRWLRLSWSAREQKTDS